VCFARTWIITNLMTENETKCITIEVVKNHPRLLKFPSLSRNLYNSILPKNYTDIYNKPQVLIVRQKSASMSKPPVLSNRKRKLKKPPKKVLKPPRNLIPTSNQKLFDKLIQNYKPRAKSTPNKKRNTADFNPKSRLYKSPSRVDLTGKVVQRRKPSESLLAKINIPSEEDLKKINEAHSSQEENSEEEGFDYRKNLTLSFYK